MDIKRPETPPPSAAFLQEKTTIQPNKLAVLHFYQKMAHMSGTKHWTVQRCIEGLVLEPFCVSYLMTVLMETGRKKGALLGLLQQGGWQMSERIDKFPACCCSVILFE
ncbi:hypothetical protein INR49_012918 [Caranx melampygus]|nr:hypothetical protein INR49_012918 [Caranx melampygus]